MRGHLIRSPERGNLPKNIKWVKLADEEFRVLSVNPKTDEIKVVGIFTDFAEARKEVDKNINSGLYFYVHGKENRVLYSREAQ